MGESGPRAGAAGLQPGSRLARLLRHRWLDETDVVRALGAQGLARLEARIAAAEAGHAGEIRVYVEAGLPLSYLWRRATARARAVALFGKLGVWDTDRNTGVLIYLLLAERKIEIVVDRGLSRCVDSTVWQRMVDGLAADIRAGRALQGLESAVDSVAALLRQQVPLAPGAHDSDELPNRVELGG